MLQLLLLAPLLAPQVAKHKTSDRVVVEDGKEYIGRVIYEDDEKVLMRVKSKTHEFATAEVAEISTLERSQRELFVRLDPASPDDATTLVALAEFAAERGLVGESRMLYAKAIFADPENAVAFEALEGREHKQKGWQVKIGKRWKTLPEIQELHGKWRDHFEVQTTHFIVRSDMPAALVVDLALDVERYYLAFYEVLGTRLNLQMFDALPIVNAYEEISRMPKPPVPIEAWYAQPRNELDIAATEGVSRELIAREMTRLMLSNSLRKTFNKAGNLPPWAQRGISNIFAGSVILQKRPMTFDFTRVYEEWFRLQAENPVELKRILAMADAEFWDDGSAAHDAAGYTLVHFLVHGDEGKWFEGFRDYLESSYLGKGAETHFLRNLGIKKLDEIEPNWNAYVKGKAGL